MTSYHQRLTSAKKELFMSKWIGENFHGATEEGKGKKRKREDSVETNSRIQILHTTTKS
jgi:hypothetical protein